jgi:hypothetical protein
MYVPSSSVGYQDDGECVHCHTICLLRGSNEPKSATSAPQMLVVRGLTYFLFYVYVVTIHSTCYKIVLYLLHTHRRHVVMIIDLCSKYCFQGASTSSMSDISDDFLCEGLQSIRMICITKKNLV